MTLKDWIAANRDMLFTVERDDYNSPFIGGRVIVLKTTRDNRKVSLINGPGAHSYNYAWEALATDREYEVVFSTDEKTIEWLMDWLLNSLEDEVKPVKEFPVYLL